MEGFFIFLLFVGLAVGFGVTASALSKRKNETNRLEQQIDVLWRANQAAGHKLPPRVPVPPPAPPVYAPPAGVPAPYTPPPGGGPTTYAPPGAPMAYAPAAPPPGVPMQQQRPVPPPAPPQKVVSASVPVTVAGKRRELGPGSAMYFVTFRTSGGVKRELLVPMDDYIVCNVDDTGTLLFDKSEFRGFQRDAAAAKPASAPVPPPAPPGPTPPAPPPAYTPPPAPPAYAPPPAVQPAQPAEPKKSRRPGRTESVVGRNILGIAASVLTFIGLIYLGVLIYENLTDTLRIILMFSFSGVLTGLGVFLSVKNSNTFTHILTGCGCGAFFISIMLTHLYFGRLPDFAAFSILLAWLAGALRLAGWLKSTSISVVAHIGMAISICFAYAMTDAHFAALLVYQMVSIAVVIAGNMLYSKKTYHFSLILSFALTLAASGFIWPLIWTADGPAVMSALLAQFLCASLLSWLLADAVNRLENRALRVALHLGNKLMWTAALIMNIYCLVLRVARHVPALEGGEMTALSLAAAAGIVFAVLHGCASLLRGRKQKLRGELETISVLLMSSVAGVLLLITWGMRFVYPLRISQLLLPQLSLLLLPALLLLLARRASPRRAYSIAAMVWLVLDFLLMLGQGYGELARVGTIALPLGYMLIYLGFILRWSRSNRDNEKYRMAARLLGLLVTEVSLIPILLLSDLKLKGMILLLALTVLNAAANLLRFEGRNGKKSPLYYFLRVSEGLLVTANVICVAFDEILGAPIWLVLPLFGLSMVLALTRTRENLFGEKIKHGEEALYLLKATLLIIAAVFAFTRALPCCGTVVELAITALCILYHLARKLLYRRRGLALTASPFDILIRISESLLLFINAIALAAGTGNPDVPGWMYLLLFALSMVLTLTRVRENLLGEKIRPGEEVICLLKTAALIMAFVFYFARPSAYCGVIMLLAGSALCIAFQGLRHLLYQRAGLASADTPTGIVLRVCNVLLFAGDAAYIAFSPKDGVTSALGLALAALAAALAFMHARKLFTGGAKSWEEVFYGLKLTVLAMAVVYGHTQWFDSAFVVSLVSMLTALACIAVGFRYQTRFLRMYGLILTLLCVLKLVTYDVSGLVTELRVAALIGGGIICFLISAIYSYSAKKIDAAAARESVARADGQ